jgi:hypothetical protein
MENIAGIQVYKKKCELLLQIPDIRFAGVMKQKERKCLWKLFFDKKLEKNLIII